jgi:hypothetical protein
MKLKDNINNIEKSILNLKVYQGAEFITTAYTISKVASNTINNSPNNTITNLVLATATCLSLTALYHTTNKLDDLEDYQDELNDELFHEKLVHKLYYKSKDD